MGVFREKYDAIIIGGSLSGLSCALQLGMSGVKSLVLEQHNLPGGLATSFVRNEFEFEATLHEMMSIGPKDKPLKIREFLDEAGVEVDWRPVPEAYRVIVHESNLDVTVPYGFENLADVIEKECPGTRERLMDLLTMCKEVYDSVNYMSTHTLRKAQMLKDHNHFVTTAGYTAAEVIAKFNLPKRAIEILSPYWIYVGVPLDRLSFTVWAFLMSDYFTGGSYVCTGNSHALSLAMDKRARGLGAQIEYRTRVSKILVKSGKTYGVRLEDGTEIYSNYVISGAYPDKVYSCMIELADEVPKGAIKLVNARDIGVTAFTVFLALEGTPEELNIDSYSYFCGTTLDTEKIWANYQTTNSYDFITSICLNIAVPECFPKGTTQLSITALPKPDGWENVSEDDYNDLKRAIASDMIDHMSWVLGVDLKEKIIEIEISAPMTIAHYTRAWKGSVYGYEHQRWDSVVARLQMDKEDHFIKGLEFAGAHATAGNGMGPCMTNGRKAAKAVLDAMKEVEQ